MKKLTQISVMLLGLMVIFAGCDAAKDAAKGAADKAGDMANVDLGDFDMKGMTEKFAEITSGLKDVSSDNVDGLTSKISGLTSSMDSMGLDKLTGPAKKTVGTAMTAFADKVKAALEGISDEGLLGKLKPVVEALMEKINAFTA